MLINGNLILGSTILKRTGVKATITYNLTNCISTNTAATVSKNGTYTTTLVADTSFSYVGVRIIMGIKDITANSYNMSTGVVNITNVDGNITITAEKLTTFSNASWYAIKCVAQNNFANTLGWAIGDTKSLIIGDYSYTARICDLTENRYQYLNDTTRYTNMVIETVELLPDSQPRNNSHIGNYNDNNIRLYYDETVIPMLPQDLQNALETVIIPTYWLTDTSTGAAKFGTSANKLFMPSSKETGSTDTTETESVYQYYDLQTISAREKKKINEGNFSIWWTRTSGYFYSVYGGGIRFNGPIGRYITTSGTYSGLIFSQTSGGPYVDDRALTSSHAIPVFWAW